VSNKPFVRVKVTVQVELVEQRQTVRAYSKHAILVAPERKLSPQLLQDAAIDAVVDKVVDRLMAINEEHEAQTSHPD